MTKVKLTIEKQNFKKTIDKTLHYLNNNNDNNNSNNNDNNDSINDNNNNKIKRVRRRQLCFTFVTFN